MGAICSRLLPESILLDPPDRDKVSLLRRLVDSLAEAGIISETETLMQEVLAREELAPTALGFGCAIPHAQSEMFTKTIIAIARLRTPIESWSPESDPVSLVFLMVGPKNSASLHIRLLSKLARLLHDTEFRESLLAAETVEDLLDILDKKEE